MSYIEMNQPWIYMCSCIIFRVRLNIFGKDCFISWRGGSLMGFLVLRQEPGVYTRVTAGMSIRNSSLFIEVTTSHGSPRLDGARLSFHFSLWSSFLQYALQLSLPSHLIISYFTFPYVLLRPSFFTMLRLYSLVT